ncbi:MAG TPA: hypothetical protein VGH02_01495 [Rhizomicrobium sp.]
MYEVRFVKSDGRSTLILVTPSLAEVEGIVPAADAVKYERAEIWLDGLCIRTINHNQLMPVR